MHRYYLILQMKTRKLKEVGSRAAGEMLDSFWTEGMSRDISSHRGILGAVTNQKLTLEGGSGTVWGEGKWACGCPQGTSLYRWSFEAHKYVIRSINK